jgi:hypothetical protein
VHGPVVEGARDRCELGWIARPEHAPAMRLIAVVALSDFAFALFAVVALFDAFVFSAVVLTLLALPLVAALDPDLAGAATLAGAACAPGVHDAACADEHEAEKQN